MLLHTYYAHFNASIIGSPLYSAPPAQQAYMAVTSSYSLGGGKFLQGSKNICTVIIRLSQLNRSYDNRHCTTSHMWAHVRIHVHVLINMSNLAHAHTYTSANYAIRSTLTWRYVHRPVLVLLHGSHAQHPQHVPDPGASPRRHLEHAGLADIVVRGQSVQHVRGHLPLMLR